MTDEIPFPYVPYAPQQQLMKAIANLLQSTEDHQTRQWSKVGIFESPTGTGKSLSLICASLHWLFNIKRAPTSIKSDSADEVDWIQAFANDMKQAEQSEHERQQAIIEETRKTLSSMKTHDLIRAVNGAAPMTHRGARKRVAIEICDTQTTAADEADDADLIVDWTDDQTADKAVDAMPEWKRLIEQDKRASQAQIEAVRTDRLDAQLDNELAVKPQIIVCSRTHSQLSQLISEIRKTVFNDEVRVLSLGSRAQLCQHPSVQALKSTHRMNDACLDMQQSKAKAKEKQAKLSRSSNPLHEPCPYLADPPSRLLFRQHALTSIHDVEDLSSLGSRLSTCSYYGARSLINSAHIIAMPYQSLLSKSTRESLGIDDDKLAQSIVIFDEAHNLVEAINDMHSFTVTQTVLSASYERLSEYERKFRDRFKPVNLQMVQQLIQFTHAFASFLERFQGEPNLFTVSQLIVECAMDSIDFFRLHRFVKESELHKKLGRFVERGADDDASAQGRTSSSFIHQLDQLIIALCNQNTDGRLIVEKTKLRFLLLNASVAMSPIIKRSRAVLLLGGTMQPFDHHIQQLFQELPPEYLTTFACGHVIDSRNVICLSLAKGPTNVGFEFGFANRDNMAMKDELGRTLLNLCAIVPSGMIAFFQSHSSLASVLDRLKASGMYERLNAKKRVFVESSDESAESAMSSFAESTTTSGSALLFAVVGGRLSEGINFADELCRCVVMVGLPYANPHEIELKSRMKFVEEKQLRLTQKSGGASKYYESLCMRQINQSIGRSIRHSRDHSAILLLDTRYSAPHVQAALPSWIQARAQCHQQFHQSFKAMKEFFESMKQCNQPVTTKLIDPKQSG